MSLKTTTPIPPFTRQLHVRWGDLDVNAHMRNTAYLDMAADVRMMFFAEHGFTLRDFERRRVGPVILRDEVDYHRELKLHEVVTVDLVAAGMSEDGSRFRLRSHFVRADGKASARVTSTGGWLDLDARKLAEPPEDLRRALLSIPQSTDFEILPDSTR